MINSKYKFIINIPYELTEQDIEEIETDSCQKWGDGYKKFKKNIRQHLKQQQYKRCAFCRCKVNEGTSYSNLEHLISKKDYPQFKTYPKNLVYSCWPCNQSKRKELTVKNLGKEVKVFPNNKEDFIIVNPYFDNYEDNIDFEENIIIRAKSEKGKNTIIFYNLYRPGLAEARAEELKLDKEKTKRNLLYMLSKIIELNNDDENNTINYIQQVLNEMPNWVIEEA